MFYLPGWIYETLPYLYFALGGAAMVGLDTNWGRVSGFMLAGMAAIILKLRKENRRQAAWQVARM